MKKNETSDFADSKIEVFNPLDKKHLGESLLAAILSEKLRPLSELKKFKGAGVYAIYYKGNFPLYKPLVDALNKEKYLWPIYVGRTEPNGSRTGNSDEESLSSDKLFSRLNNHYKSINDAENLNVADFLYSYLIVDDIWIPLGESVLIQRTRPLWNSIVSGFGNHKPGKNRETQKRSLWDTLHPGRDWARSLPIDKKKSEIEKMVQNYFEKKLIENLERNS